jgi:drug/metabolite transporter (DMT)-like permease
LRPALKAKTRRWWPFILLLLAASSRWLVADAHPEAAPTLLSATLGCGWAALLLFVFLPRIPTTTAHTLRMLVAGALFLAGPAIGLILGARNVSAAALTMALALTPVAVALGASAFGIAGREGVAGRIWPGLAAVTGLLLILVQPDLGNPLTDAALFLAPILTGLGAALFESSSTELSATHPTEQPAHPAAALLGATALFTLATAASFLRATHTTPHVSLIAIAYEGLLALLSVLALSRLGATRWSSQFTWLPLLILLEGILLARPPVTARWLTGLALLTIASLYLLTPQVDEPETAPTLIR